MAPRSLAAPLVVLAILMGLTLTPATLAAAPSSTGGPPGPTGGGSNGTLSLSVSPASALVQVNGTMVAVNATGAASVSLAAGTYRVDVTAPKYQEFEANVTVVASSTAYVPVHLTLLPPPASKGPISRLPPLSVWATAIAAVVLVVLAFVLLRPSRQPASAAPPQPPAPAAVRPTETDEGPV